ncbi:6445_t:CDS:2, partial [Racocetra fulgida]
MSVILKDLNDYISPSQACIKPVEVQKTSKDNNNVIKIDNSGGYYEVSQEGIETKLQPANISLEDYFSLLESAREFVERYRKFHGNRDPSSFLENVSIKNNRIKRESTSSKDATQHKSSCDICLPVLASSCPGWICYAEKTHKFILPYISETKSPQQIMGSIVKDHLASKLGIGPNNIYHVGIMMCYDKKLEASRSDFFNEEYQTRDVDCVLTTGEVIKMFEEQNFNINESLEIPLDSFVKTSKEGQLLRSPGSASGGFLEFILEYSARELFGITGVDVEKEQGVVIKTGRNKDFKEISLEVDGKPLLKFASAYGFRNIQNIVRKIKSGNSPYHYIEVMACPSGCINGGGQLKPNETIPIKDWINE